MHVLQDRTAYWRSLGFSLEEVRFMLDRMPRLLLYPMQDPKYQLKLAFLTGALVCCCACGARLDEMVGQASGAAAEQQVCALVCIRSSQGWAAPSRNVACVTLQRSWACH